jgi:hypothetical protein
VLETLGLEEPPEVGERIERLARRADEVDFSEVEQCAKRW